MSVYLVSDIRPEYLGDMQPYWRVVAYCSDLIHAKRYAMGESVVTLWHDEDAAWRVYKKRVHPQNGPFSVIG